MGTTSSYGAVQPLGSRSYFRNSAAQSIVLGDRQAMKYLYSRSLAVALACAVAASVPQVASAATPDDGSGQSSAHPARSGQAKPSTPPQSGKTGPQLEAVTVTAQRRSQSLQKVPVTDNVFTSGQLRARQVITTSDVLANVPNVVTLSGSGYSQANYYFRGIGENDGYQTFNSAVATYIDDVVIDRLGGADSELIDLDRVEVLQGPQGTTFGQNTPGGAVLLYSKKPTDDFHASAETAFGTHDQSDSRFMVNDGLLPGLDGRLNAFVFRNDGYQNDINTGENGYGGQMNWGVRGALRYSPTDNLDWNVSYDFSDLNGQRYDAGTNPNNPTQWNQPAGILGDSYTHLTTDLNDCTNGTSAIDWERNNCSGSVTTNQGLTSNLRWTVEPDLNIEFITGLRRASQDYVLDVGFDSPFTGSGLKDLALANDSLFEQFSQEVKANGQLFNGFINYVGGLYAFNEWDETNLDEFLRIGTALHAPASARTDNYHEFIRNGTQSEAAYLQTDTHLTNQFTLTTGIRYTHEREQVEVNTTDPAAGNAPIYNTSQIAGQPVLSTYRFTPKVALTYQFTPDFMVYGSYVDGFQAGGWNGRASTAQEFTSFGNEKAQSWELGWRSELFNRRLRFNGTFFWVNYNGLQLSSAAVVNGENTEIFANAGNSQTRGIQLDAEAVATRNLTINAGLGLQEAKFTELAPGVVATGLTLNSAVPFSPPVTWNVGFTYRTDEMPWARGRFTLNGTFQYIPVYNTGASATSTDSQVTTNLNASLTYRPTASHWTVGAECTNCTFRIYVPIQAGTFDYISPPGYAGIRVRYEM